jgi:hypothetical protein
LSAEISASFEKLQAPVSSRAMPPESISERSSSFVNKGFPSVASRSRPASDSETFVAPTSDSTSERCSEGDSGPSVTDTNLGSSANESSIRVSGWRRSVSVCR